jgi:hypothetical protein
MAELKAALATRFDLLERSRAVFSAICMRVTPECLRITEASTGVCVSSALTQESHV